VDSADDAAVACNPVPHSGTGWSCWTAAGSQTETTGRDAGAGDAGDVDAVPSQDAADSADSQRSLSVPGIGPARGEFLLNNPGHVRANYIPQ